MGHRTQGVIVGTVHRKACKKRGRVLTLAALALILAVSISAAGCGGSGEREADPPEPAPATAVVTQPSAAAAAAAYLKIAEAENPRLSRIVVFLEKAYEEDDAAAITRGMEQLATLERRFQAKLVAITMPASTVAASDALVTALGRAAASADAVADNPYAEDGSASLRQTLADVSSTTRILRARLGLPPPPKVG